MLLMIFFRYDIFISSLFAIFDTTIFRAAAIRLPRLHAIYCYYADDVSSPLLPILLMPFSRRYAAITLIMLLFRRRRHAATLIRLR